MRDALLRVATCLLLSLSLVCAGATASFAAESEPAVFGAPLAGDPLLDEGGQQAAAEAERSSPEAVAAREASRTEFDGLNAEQAATTAAEAFPDVINVPAGGLPPLPAGQTVTGYVSESAASVELEGGEHGVVESVQPIAVESSAGQLAPVDLGLESTGNGFVPRTPVVEVLIPRQLDAGASLKDAGVSLTPVDGSGAPLGGSAGIVDGSTVLYANTQTDMDSVMKPTTAGLRADTMLRSPESPEQLFLRVGLPAGGRVVPAQDGSGGVEVVAGGVAVATISAPAATDAAGWPVPVSMSFTGDTLALTVDHRSGEYQYPIEVDPELTDSQLTTTAAGKRTNWEFYTTNSSRFASKPKNEEVGEGYLETYGTASYSASEWAYWGYQTKGKSKIWEYTGETEGKNVGDHIESFLELQGKGAVQENKKQLSTNTVEPEYPRRPTGPICPLNEAKIEQVCLPTAGGEGNVIRFQQSVGTPEAGKFAFIDYMYQGVVSISEPTGTRSTTKFNTTSAEIEDPKTKVKRANALFGSGGWLSNFQDALEPIAEDKGIGVADTKLEFENTPGHWEQIAEHNYLETENGCKGVQCYEVHGEYWTVPSSLPNGEDTLRYRAQEAIGSSTESLETEASSKVKVKVDKAAPHGIKLLGLPYGNELSERPYELTVQATDGEGPTIASSGVKSITLYIDGTSVGTPLGSCTAAKGECTASGTWTVNGAELGAGHHAIEVVTFDNAKNEARRPFEITIRHSTPVAMGPGSVDLQSGDFSFSAGDVSMGSGLSVSQSYSSRALEQGIEGGLGPQWTLGLSSTESVEELVDGAVLLTDGKGRQSVFAPTGEHNAAGELVFEAPAGDSNLAMTLAENKATKEKLAYYLRNAANGTSVKFTLPTGGSRLWVPTRQEGAVASDTVIYSYETATQSNEYPLPSGSTPAAVAKGPDGNVWVAEAGTHKIARMTTAGAVTEYTLPSGLSPHGIAAGPEGTMWFTASSGATSKIGKITTQGAFTEYGLPASSSPTAITAGPDGRMWFTDSGTGQIGKIVDSGAFLGEIKEYALPAGSAPNGITAGPDGNLWYTEWIVAGGVSKIGKITTAGVKEEFALPPGSEPFQITPGPKEEKALWFTDLLSDKVGKITTGGTPTEYSLPAGSSSPEGIVAGPDGNLWYTDEGASKIGKITTAGAATEYALPAGSNPDAIVTGPDQHLWFANQSHGVGTMTTTATVTRPTQELAPVPAEVTCAPGALQAGCRLLKFKYATSTTATGENESQWGDYNGRLRQVLFVAYNPATKKVEEAGIPVAEYRYDQLGRLRAEWDPRLSTPLKTTYGYDEYGHVTAISPPGQEPWTLTYGTANNDLGTGRLMKIARTAASEALWGGEAIKNTQIPSISGTPLVAGTKLSVANGKWSPAALTYGYQWQRCNLAGAACVPIVGATNASYTIGMLDAGTTLRVEVTATNGGGSATATTTATVEIKLGIEYSAGGGVPANITSGPAGENALWFTLTYGGIGKLTTGGVLTSYPLVSKREPDGIAAGADGNLWFTLEESKIGKITPTGTVTEYPLPEEGILEHAPGAIVAGPKKENALWFTEWIRGSIGKITTAGVITQYKIPHASLPESITVGPDENLWFTTDSNKIGKMTTGGVFTEYATPAELEPRAIATGPDGNLWVTETNSTTGIPRIAKINTSGATLTEYQLPKASEPLRITPGKPGENALWFTENNVVLNHTVAGKITTTGEITEATLPEFSSHGIVAGPDNNMWIASSNEIAKVNPSTTSSEPSPQPGWTINYNVPLEGTSAPAQMGINETTHKPESEAWGQNDDPVEATSITPPDSPQGWPAANYKRATTYYLDEQGRNVNVAQPSTATKGSISTTEYNEENDVIRTLTANNRATALAAGSKSIETSHLLDTINQYNEPECRKESASKEVETAPYGTRLCESWGPQHLVKYVPNGFHEQHESLARIHTKYFYEDAAHGAPESEQYDLVTETSELALLANEEEVEVRKTSTAYAGQSNLGWKLRAPTSETTSTEPEGLNVTTTTLYNKNTGQIIETRAPKGSGGNSPHDARIIYYTSATNTEGFPSCGKHPEWAELICETLPAKQPTGTTVPRLPVTTDTYNIWNEPEEIIESTEANGTFPATTRTKKSAYDAAGRLESSETTSTADIALPKVKDKYSSTTGMLESQSATIGEATSTVAGVFNKLGQMESYTDADGNTAKYKYGTPANDGLLEETSDSSNAGASNQKYTYDTTTKALTKLVDSAAGTFTATYDVEGNLATEVYPNAMCAKYTRSSTGEATQLEYLKTSNCAESKPTVWFSETDVPSVRGETMSRTSTLANETYIYDRLGRLTETQETPAGEGCTTRLYAYDEESNRESATTRTPGTEGKCATTGGTVETHTYDEANRLTDTGIKYDSLGNITELPAADAEGHILKSSFYVDGAVATQEQNGIKNEYILDPAGRTRQTTSGLKTVTSHYDAPGDAVAWTSESAEHWTRNIPGIDGALTAIQTNGGTPVLQLHDLKGNITATAALSPAETKLLTTYNNTEFGVPNAGKTPPLYSWLGATDIANTLPSGVITYGATSYIPQTGQPLQATEIEPPGAPGGTGVGAPVDFKEEPWVMQGAAAEAAKTPGFEAAEQREAQEAACRANIEVCPGYEDPIHNILLIKPSTSMEWGEALCNCAVVHDVGKVIELIVGAIGIEGVGDFVEKVLESGVGEQIGKELLTCGEAIKSNLLNRCALQLHTASIFGVDTYIPVGLNVGACYYYKKSYKGLKAKRLHCPNNAEYKRPY